jgi:hypothetical protein
MMPDEDTIKSVNRTRTYEHLGKAAKLRGDFVMLAGQNPRHEIRQALDAGFIASQIHVVEHNRKHFQVLRAAIRQFPNVRTFEGDITDLLEGLRSDGVRLAAANLDFCGLARWQVVAAGMVARLLLPRGVLAMTCNYLQIYAGREIMRLGAGSDPTSTLHDAWNSLILSTANYEGIVLKRLEQWGYHRNGRHNPMGVGVWQRKCNT